MPTRSYGRGHLWGMGSSVGALVSYGRGYLVYARCAQGKLILVCSTLRREKTRCRWRGMSISAQSRCSTSARDLPEGAPIEICQRPPRLALGFSCFFAVLSELRSHCHWQHPLASSSCTFAGLHVPIASEAGKVIKKTVMELGGSDAFIVCEDADIPKAVAAGIRGRFHNAGQVCLAAKRFILVGKIADEFERSFVEAAKSLRVGDPFNSAMDLGPMARADLRDSLHKQVEGSIAKGASLLCGGKPVEGKGAFYPPTVLSRVTEGMPAFDEETFGPVAAITRVPDLDAAVRAANASQFGLSGNLWTKNIDLSRKVARDLYTGGVFVNGITASDPRVPVGGVKNSGYGRELSHFGAHAFVNAQTVWIEGLAANRLRNRGWSS